MLINFLRNLFKTFSQFWCITYYVMSEDTRNKELPIRHRQIKKKQLLGEIA